LVDSNPGDKRLVELNYQAAHFYLAITDDATIEDLNASVVAVIERRELGNQWMIDRNPREAIDFDYCYPIVEIRRVAEVGVYIRQQRYQVKVTD
jgi:hypothetical protein